MSREIRRVPEYWLHPKNSYDRYIPLLGGDYQEDLEEWEAREDKEGESRPEKHEYMPDWPEEELTHIMMYETTSEGTPKSPAFPKDKPEELARWLVAQKVTSFGPRTSSYESWLNMITGSGYACGMVISGGVVRTGVDDLYQDKLKEETDGDNKQSE